MQSHLEGLGRRMWNFESRLVVGMIGDIQGTSEE